MFLNSIHYFRGIAIVFIVFGHCFILANFAVDTIFAKIFYNLIFGGTSYFVFISGYLFEHLFSKKFEFRNFFPKKLKFVLLPYLIMSLLPILYFVFLDGNPKEYFIPTGEGWFFEYFIPFVKYYFTGFGLIAYWYIPFIMVIFLMSPLFIYFMNLKTSIQVTIATILLILPLLLHRPNYESIVDVLQSVAYFTPIYMFGMIFSQNKKMINSKLSGKAFYFLIFGIAICLLQVLSVDYGNNGKAFFNFVALDLAVIQKLSLSIFFMVVLHNFENKKSKILDLVATNSFGIFFIHGPIIMILNRLKVYYEISIPANNLLIYLLVVAMIFFLSLGLTLLVKKIIPNHSRYFIGS